MRYFSQFCLFLAVMMAALGGARSAFAQERYLYWIGALKADETRGNTIFRYALDSSTVDTLVEARNLGLGPGMMRYLYYVTVDTLHQKIYWTDSGGEDSSGALYIGAIMRASLEGANPEIFMGGISCGISALYDIEIDVVADTLYWSEGTDCPDVTLHRTSLSSPDPSQSRMPINGNYSARAIELDRRQMMIYWTNNDFSFSEPHGIMRAPLNDTVSDEYIVLGSICDIALAHTLTKIYWTPCESRVIRRANLDGSDVEDMITSQGDPVRLAIDHKGKKIYWSEENAGRLMRANLDGTEVEELLSGLVVPTSLALNFGWDVSVPVEPEAEFPGRADLQSVYPNPVRESTTIAFVLTEPAHVTLEIYDGLGRKVEVLASGTYPPGEFQVAWSPTHQANGVYFFRMASKSGSMTIPLVLQR